ncbi:c-type cytochrome [Mesorhizobium sp. M7A.F.Ca.US.006.04.2.1]|uniref:c-type cytochrome n=1 Tax=unclassified Mesorhizobium TaxID=325217 RepID=UPI000FCC9A60|nr:MULTISPECIES: cytochrome c [unclassified Mesorhizobium]RUX76893.1 c-type cytochrome [Mesorhizobium sp. M7A.F.Ca.US.005.03.1.1]RUY03749.1 c-type cytochrome [Mesorhizobium sp. M7A.F.Ca.US.005.03.2.1]RVA85806.1 c-type cytochrome [Mesorhizobium sp. M7A.F.Ca.US.006.04.2.1]
MAAGVRRHWKWWLAAVVLAGLVVAIYFLKPVTGPARDLTLAGNAASGAYLIRLSGCDACHTDHEHNGPALAGGKPLKTKFGVFYPPNITPDKKTGIGNWTLAQFSNALSNGIGPHGKNFYPVFPYNDFTLMSDQEVVDLYAAVMATQPVSREAPANRVIFPFNIRLFISGWKNLFFSPHRYQNDPAHSAQWNRGAYLANGPAHCVTCHSPLNALGSVVQGKRFTGNPFEGPGGKAPPLTPAALLQGGYTRDGLAQTLKTGVTPNAGKVGKEMGLVVTDETSHWTDDDRNAVADYLLNLK